MPPNLPIPLLFLRLTLVALPLAIAVWWAAPGDPVDALLEHKADLVRVERMPAPELGERVERWRMMTSGGDTLRALWRAAAPGEARPWTVVLLGGLVTGDRATLLVPDDASAHVLAVDWPWREPRRMPWWRAVLRVGAIQRGVMTSPAVLALGVEAAAGAPEVAPERIALMGVSLGAAPAVSVLRLTHRPAALILLHGGADIRELLRHGLAREGVPGFLASPLSALASRLIHPLEPSLHAAAVGARPVLMINAVGDPLLPAKCVRRLHGLFPAGDVRWGAPLHGARERRVSVADATREVEAWLKTAAVAKRPGLPPGPRRVSKSA